jgi:hypothetical protein
VAERALPDDGRRSATLSVLFEILDTSPEIIASLRLEALEAEGLKRTPADRSHLLERLGSSLDPDPEVEAAWEREADRREAELDSGSVAAIPGPKAMARLRARLSR